MQYIVLMDAISAKSQGIGVQKNLFISDYNYCFDPFVSIFTF